MTPRPKPGEIWNYLHSSKGIIKYFILTVSLDNEKLAGVHGYHITAIDHDGKEQSGYILAEDKFFRSY